MGFWNWLSELFWADPDKIAVSSESGVNTAVATLEPRPTRPAQKSAQTPDPEYGCWWAPPNVIAVDPLPIASPEMTAEALAMENLLVSHFDGHDLSMPPMPRAAERVLARLRDSNSTMADVARDISEDQVMAAEVLRMSNSVFYRGAEKITNLQSAVTRLGTSALRTLMMHQSLRSAMFPKSGVDREVADRLWKRSLVSATVMRGLANFTNIDAEEAFLIGLMHDIGNVLVLRITHERQVMQTRLDWGTFEYLCFECHQEFGELIAEAWKLPPEIKSLVSNHHAYPNPDDGLRTQRWMLILTDMINQVLGFDVHAQYDLMHSRPVMELGLLGRSDVEEFLSHLPDEIDEMLSALDDRKQSGR